MRLAVLAFVVLCVTVVAQAQHGRVLSTDQRAEQEVSSRGERSDPIEMLTSYYEAINARDYRRAYGFWESPETSYERFVAGFADTDRVRLLVEPPGRSEGAAGSVYAEFTVVIVATTRAGSERVFAGCYTLRKSNVRDSGWRIYRADISTIGAGTRLSRMLSKGCRNSQ